MSLASAACVGGRPRAITKNLNSGNLTRPEVCHQLKEAVAGTNATREALGTPLTAGDVSQRYNEHPAGAVYRRR